MGVFTNEYKTVSLYLINAVNKVPLICMYKKQILICSLYCMRKIWSVMNNTEYIILLMIHCTY